MRRLKNSIGLLLVIILVIIFYTQIPLCTATLFGDDEGCELMKAFMCNKGYALYTDIWNDQPPVLTLLLTHAFKIFGPTLAVGRLIAAAFGLLLYSTFYWLVAQRLGQWKAVVATFLLIAAPDVALLSASVMLEIPAFATALLAACCLFHWTKQQRVGWLVVSGIVMGIALQIKLTPILIAPAMLVEIALAIKSRPSRSHWKTVAIPLFQWGTAVAVTVLIIVAMWARGSVLSSLKSHFGEHPPAGMVGPKDFPFQTEILVNHIECVIGAIAGIIFVIWRSSHSEISKKSRDLKSKAPRNQISGPTTKTEPKVETIRNMAFPTVFLFTVSCIHAIHRPWWGYYYLHLAIPLAWLSAFALGQAIDFGAEFLSIGKYRLSSSKTWQGIALCTLTALVLVRSERRFESILKDFHAHSTVGNDPVVGKIKEYANRTHWVYAEQDIYPFQAGLSMPPELTAVVLKRYWSRQITPEEVVNTCKRYHAELLLLNPAHVGSGWNNLLTEYNIAYSNTNILMYVTKQF